MRAVGAAHGRQRRETRRRYGSERRRSGGLGVVVHQSARGLHRDNGERPANTAASSRSGEDGSTRRTARRRGGDPLARTARGHDALQREPTAPRSPLPRGEATELLQCNRTAAETWVKHGSADRDGGEAGTYGLGGARVLGAREGVRGGLYRRRGDA
jgi:hypothetical protein